jgi:hypothetical protein
MLPSPNNVGTPLEARINKLELLRAQLGVETWWEVALWFAK